MTATRLTVALSSHRIETLALAEPLMRDHELVLLEEPADELFEAVLAGGLDIGRYVEEVAPAFPLFARASCAVSRRLHEQGVRMTQLDPFMEELASIHDGFEQGGRPDDIEAGTVQRAVYDAEHLWTAALIPFYAAASRANFGELADATLRFARADAARGRLRDALRLEAIIEAAENARSVYVEAGYLHHGLWLELRRRLRPHVDVAAIWLLEPVVRRRSGRRQVLSPGDVLTLAYTLRPERGSRPHSLHDERLLAARSLVYQRIALKEETPPGDDPHPHTTDELEANDIVNGLSYPQCEQLYGQIRDLPQPAARTRARKVWARSGALAS